MLGWWEESERCNSSSLTWWHSTMPRGDRVAAVPVQGLRQPTSSLHFPGWVRSLLEGLVSVTARSPDLERSLLGEPASGHRQSRLDVVIHAEEIGGVVFLFDRRQPCKVGAERRVDDLLGFDVERRCEMRVRGKRSENFFAGSSPVPVARRFGRIRSTAR